MERQGEPGMFPMSAAWRPGPLALWLGAALALAASWHVPPLARIWEAADHAIFRLLNGTIAQSDAAAAIWAIGCEPRFAAFLALTLLAAFLVRLGHERGQGFRHDMALGLSVLVVSVALFALHIAAPDILRPSPAASLPGHHAISSFLPWSEAGLNPLSPFPAGHAVLTGSLTVLLWMGFGLRLGLAALAFTVLLALPRIATGTEWTTDIIAGGGVAALATLALATGTPVVYRLYRLAHLPVDGLLARWEGLTARLSVEGRENYHPAKQTLRGMCIGAADLVPGVSGGTMALILGVYKRLISAIAHFDRELLGNLRRLDFTAAARHVDLLFILPIGVGALLSLIIFSRVIPLSLLVASFPEMTFGFFFGLIAASIVGLIGHVETGGARGIAWIAFGTCLGLLAAILVPVDTPDAAWFVFLCGMAAIAAMLVPGISGSFVLLILGKYTDAIDALGRLDMSFLLPLAGGVVTGALIFSRAISWLLERFYRRTMLTVIGVLCGSLLAVWPFKDRQYEMIHGKAKLVSADPFVPVNIDGTVVTGVVAILAGIALYRFLDRLAQLPNES
ncbi:MAG: DUF368 domain-containing protein [Parvibaculum sp.]